jgi:hypothetical protein
MPDIAIPYVAEDYLSGKDAMLEKLLGIIKNETVRQFSYPIDIENKKGAD